MQLLKRESKELAGVGDESLSGCSGLILRPLTGGDKAILPRRGFLSLKSVRGPFLGKAWVWGQPGFNPLTNEPVGAHGSPLSQAERCSQNEWGMNPSQAVQD